MSISQKYYDGCLKEAYYVLISFLGLPNIHFGFMKCSYCTFWVIFLLRVSFCKLFGVRFFGECQQVCEPYGWDVGDFF